MMLEGAESRGSQGDACVLADLAFVHWTSHVGSGG